MITLRALAPYAAPKRPVADVRACELCAAAIGATHRHVLELGAGPHGVKCACQACALLFDRGSAPPLAGAGARFRTVPDRVKRDDAFALDAAAWAQLGVPVGLAFFQMSRGAVRVGYPGPAGITDAELDDIAWTRVAEATPLAQQLADDVEALLVHGERGAPKLACYLVPITRAYELAGMLRASWHGFSGGDAARAQLATFFAALDREATADRNPARGG